MKVQIYEVIIRIIFVRLYFLLLRILWNFASRYSRLKFRSKDEMKGETQKSLITMSVTNPYRLISHSGRERIRFCLLASVDTGRLQGVTMWPGGRSSKLDQWKPFAPWMTPSWEFLLASYFLFSRLLRRYLFIFMGSLRPDAIPVFYLLEAGRGGGGVDFEIITRSIC